MLFEEGGGTVCTVMRRLTTGLCSEKWDARRFRRFANVLRLYFTQTLEPGIDLASL